MKTHTQHTQKGFIALFFTLGVSSILLAYVAASSAAVFDFMRAREGFYTSRLQRAETLQCADYIIDSMLRSRYIFASVSSGCDVSEAYISDIHADTVNFSFVSRGLHVKGTIVQGFISSVTFFNFSL